MPRWLRSLLYFPAAPSRASSASRSSSPGSIRSNANFSPPTHSGGLCPFLLVPAADSSLRRCPDPIASLADYDLQPVDDARPCRGSADARELQRGLYEALHRRLARVPRIVLHLHDVGAQQAVRRPWRPPSPSLHVHLQVDTEFPLHSAQRRLPELRVPVQVPPAVRDFVVGPAQHVREVLPAAVGFQRRGVPFDLPPVPVESPGTIRHPRIRDSAFPRSLRPRPVPARSPRRTSSGNAAPARGIWCSPLLRG